MLGVLPKGLGAAVEVEGLVPLSKGEPKGLVVGAVAPESNSDELALPVPELVDPAPNEEDAPAPVPVPPQVVELDPPEAPKDEAAPPLNPESSCPQTEQAFHTPPAITRAIQCRRELME